MERHAREGTDCEHTENPSLDLEVIRPPPWKRVLRLAGFNPPSRRHHRQLHHIPRIPGLALVRFGRRLWGERTTKQTQKVARDFTALKNNLSLFGGGVCRTGRRHVDLVHSAASRMVLLVR